MEKMNIIRPDDCGCGKCRPVPPYCPIPGPPGPPGPQGPGGCEFMPERLEILKNCEADCIFRKSMLT